MWINSTESDHGFLLLASMFFSSLILACTWYENVLNREQIRRFVGGERGLFFAVDILPFIFYCYHRYLICVVISFVSEMDSPSSILDTSYSLRNDL